MSNSIRKLTIISLLLAIAIVLTMVENLIPIDFGMVGIKLGLANIVVMFCLLTMGARSAFLIVLAKALFVMFSKGTVAFSLSMGGGLLAFLVMYCLIKNDDQVSYILISVLGAMAFNIGQLIMISIWYSSLAVFYYLPVLLISGIVTGIITASILSRCMPLLRRLY